MAEPVFDDEADLLAAELALSVLEGEERARALRLRLIDSDFDAAVTRWDGRFAPMLDSLPERQPPPDMWKRVERRIAPRGDRALVRQLHVWRSGAIAAGIAATLLLAVLLLRPFLGGEPGSEPLLIAQLSSKAGEQLVLAQYDRRIGALRVRMSNLPRTNRLPELWVIPSGGKPHSLGLLTRVGEIDVRPDMASRALLQQGAVLALTMEPATGAPHAAPSGTILGSASLAGL